MTTNSAPKRTGLTLFKIGISIPSLFFGLALSRLTFTAALRPPIGPKVGHDTIGLIYRTIVWSGITMIGVVALSLLMAGLWAIVSIYQDRG